MSVGAGVGEAGDGLGSAGVDVAVGRGVEVGRDVGVTDGVAVGVVLGDAVLVGVAVLVRVAVDGVVAVGEGVTVADGDAMGVAVVSITTAVWVAVDVAVSASAAATPACSGAVAYSGTLGDASDANRKPAATLAPTAKRTRATERICLSIYSYKLSLCGVAVVRRAIQLYAGPERWARSKGDDSGPHDSIVGVSDRWYIG